VGIIIIEIQKRSVAVLTMLLRYDTMSPMAIFLQSKRAQSKITSLDRGLRILQVLSAESEGLGVTEVSRRVVADKSVVYRTLSLLMQHDYIEQNPATKKYVLGFKVVELANRRLKSIGLLSVAKPILKEVARQTGEIVVLAAMIGDVLAYLDKEEGQYAVHISNSLGQPIAPHATASGKAILAHMPEPDLVRFFTGKGLPALTEKTITSFGDFKAHLAEVRRQGYAVDDEENYPGIRCVAAPIRNHRGTVLGSISISGTTQRINPENITVFADICLAGAEQISSGLGYVSVDERRVVP
jgi:DNA-binding IclR family transcriptional regulator